MPGTSTRRDGPPQSDGDAPVTDRRLPTLSSILETFRRVEIQPGEVAGDPYVAQALERNKRQGLVLAVRARWIALGAVAVLVFFLNPGWDQIYYLALIGLFMVLGWAQLHYGRVGRSRAELLLLFCDLALMTFVLLVPNPLSAEERPLASQYWWGGFVYYFILLAGGTLSYSWRTIMAMGVWTASLWMIGLVVMLLIPDRYPELSDIHDTAFAGSPEILAQLDPNNLSVTTRIQEAAVFLIVAAILALGVRRSNYLIMQQAAIERERTNLARYFSPNVVDQLAQNDEPLKSVRSQKVAVLFVDIVGFTTYSDGRDPQQVIATLRDFHALMEQEVFRHNGTLDKYLGDGLMATFGTPIAGDSDAANALKCACAMLKTAADWNTRREAKGEPPISVSFGLHYGDAVLGDIGATRLEYAVIGSTVNVASRLEAMSRSLGAPIVVSDQLLSRAREENGGTDIGRFEERRAQPIRGLSEPIDVWTLNGNAVGRA